MPLRDGAFDLAFLVSVLGEIPDRRAAMQEYARILRPGGTLAVTEALPDPDYVRTPVLRRLAADAGLEAGSEDPSRIGVITGTGVGGLATIISNCKTLHERGPHRLSPFLIPRMMCNAASGHIAILHGFQGPNFTTVSACASAQHALGAAFDNIVSGRCDAVVTGGRGRDRVVADGDGADAGAPRGVGRRADAAAVRITADRQPVTDRQGVGAHGDGIRASAAGVGVIAHCDVVAARAAGVGLEA